MNTFVGDTADLFINQNAESRSTSFDDATGGTAFYDLGGDDFVFMDVCGMLYVSLKHTLERFPTTLLGNKDRRQRFFVKSRNACFFDRNRQCFEAILYYYQSGGMLVRPPSVPIDIFLEEVTFFDLGEDEINALRESEGYESDYIDPVNNLPKYSLQRKIWQLMEYPDSSRAARILSSFSLFTITLSIVVFCMETMPMFGVENRKLTIRQYWLNHSGHDHDEPMERYVQPWFSLEISCIIWFSLEYVVRLLSSPCKWRFFINPLNIIDLLAILPYLITMTTTTGVLRVFRLVRIFRVFKLSRHSQGLQILGRTLRASISELAMLMFFLFLGIILFSSAIYYAEHGEKDSNFHSIPDAFWYSIVTMTTVGYGDKVPHTFAGKVVGSLCAVSGVLTIALPVPVIVSNFEFYCRRDRQKYTKKKKELRNGSVKELRNGSVKELSVIN